MKGLRVLVSLVLLLVLSSGMVMAQASYSTTNVIMVNGIMVPNSNAWTTSVAKFRDDFKSAHASIASSINFAAQYNKSNGLFPDLMQSAATAANVPDMGPFLDDFNNITSPDQGILGLMGSGVFLSNYLGHRFADRLTVTVALQPQDFKDLVAAAKTSLRNKQRVILAGHSQGNYYVNYAYQQLVADTAFQKSIGISLPNQNLLSVVGIANPASWSPDGRYAYVTHCNDIINVVPLHLPSNIGSVANCKVQDVVLGPITPEKIGGLIPLAKTWINYPDWPSRWSYMLLHPLNAVWEGMKVADFNNWKYVGRLLYATQQHLLDANALPVGLPVSSYYMYPGSDTQKRVYKLLEDSLPDQLCGAAIDCFMKDDFRSASFTPKWQQVRLQGPNSSIRQQSGVLVLTAAGVYVSGGGPGSSFYAPGFATLRTRKVFANKFSLDTVINHIGGGRSTLALRRVKNDDLVWSFSLDNGPNKDNIECYPQFNGLVFLPTASGFSGRRNLRVTSTGTKVSLFVNNVEWNSATIIPGEAYYFEVSSEGDNIFELYSFVVTQNPQAAAPPPPPPPPPSSLFSITKLACTPNPTTTQTLTSCKLTGTNFQSASQFALFGGNCNPTTGCSIVTDATSSSYTPTSRYFEQLFATSGTYTLKGRYSSSNDWVVAPGNVTVNAVVSGTVAVVTPGYTGKVDCALNGAVISAPVNLTGKAVGDYTLSCLPPPGYAITAVLPSVTQTLTANATVTFTLQLAPAQYGLSELFATPPNYSNNWNYQALLGTPDITYVSGQLTGHAVSSYPGAVGEFKSIKKFGGNIVVEYTFNHHKSGRTYVGMFSLVTNTWMLTATLDTDDTNFLSFSGATRATEWKYPGTPYMNRPITVRIETVGNSAKFYVDGTYMETMDIVPSQEFVLAFNFGSIYWKSGDNVTDFLSIVAQGNPPQTSDPSAPLTATCAPSKAVIAPGESTTFTGSNSGGKGPFSGIWNGAVVGNGPSATYTSTPQTVLGSYSATYKVTDSSTPPQTATASCSVQLQLAPPSFSLAMIASSKTVLAGIPVNYEFLVTPLNGFNNQVTMFPSGLPAGVSIVNPSLNFQVGPNNVAVFTLQLQTTGGTPPGTYPFTIQVQGMGIDQFLYPSLIVTAPPAGPLSISCYFSPPTITLGSGSTLFCSGSGGSLPYQYCLNGGQCQSSASTVVQPSSVGTVNYPASVRDANGTVVSTSASIIVSGVAPTVTGMVWDSQPVGNTNFSGYINGSGFVPEATVWLYGPGCLTGCPHPSAGVSVLSLNQIRVVNVRLASGSFQLEVRTPYGSVRSSSFGVN